MSLPFLLLPLQAVSACRLPVGHYLGDCLLGHCQCDLPAGKWLLSVVKPPLLPSPTPMSLVFLVLRSASLLTAALVNAHQVYTGYFLLRLHCSSVQQVDKDHSERPRVAGPGPTSQPQCGPFAYQSLPEFGAVSGTLPRDSTHRSISLSACYLCMYAYIYVCMHASIYLDIIYLFILREREGFM